MAIQRFAGPAVEKVAGAALGGKRVIAVVDNLAVHADHALPAHFHAIRGISVGAVSIGVDVQIQIDGPLTELSWNWTPGLPLFASTGGLLTQTAPATGAVVQVGRADTATTIIIQIQPPIVQA